MNGAILFPECVTDDGYGTDKKCLISKYRYTIAFENTAEDDYVTEKFWEPLQAGSVPIYRGAPNIADHAASEASFINANNLTAKDLANFLLGIKENNTYSELEGCASGGWRDRPFSNGFLKASYFSLENNWSCRLCNEVRNRSISQ